MAPPFCTLSARPQNARRHTIFAYSALARMVLYVQPRLFLTSWSRIKANETAHFFFFFHSALQVPELFITHPGHAQCIHVASDCWLPLQDNGYTMTVLGHQSPKRVEKLSFVVILSLCCNNKILIVEERMTNRLANV